MCLYVIEIFINKNKYENYVKVIFQNYEMKRNAIKVYEKCKTYYKSLMIIGLNRNTNKNGGQNCSNNNEFHF